MEPDKDKEHIALSKVRGTFQDHKVAIEEWLSDVTETQLHFFWTFGRKPSDVSEKEDAFFQVDVGGKKYAEAFPLYLRVLLEETPLSFKVNFVCDQLTHNSNAEWLGSLEKDFGSRFKITLITEVIKNIKNNFPEHEEIIDSIFCNAEGGNPAIASDLYRLVAMIYGHPFEPTDLKSKRFVYGDVDIVTNGLPGSESLKLLKALFKKLSLNQEKPFRIGRGDGRNDVVKLEVCDLDPYKEFCQRALEMLIPHKISSIDYYPHLYSFISAAEREGECALAFDECLKYVSKQSFTHHDIFQITGPGLLDTLNRRYGMEIIRYPGICTWAWYGAELLEIGNAWFPVYSHRKMGILTFKSSEDDLIRFAFNEYSKKVALAFYARRFGENHPFYCKLFTHLEATNPFKDTEVMANIKARLKKCYEYDSKKGIKMSVEDWLISQLEFQEESMEILKEACFYPRLQRVLKTLGIEFELTVEDLDFSK